MSSELIAQSNYVYRIRKRDNDTQALRYNGTNYVLGSLAVDNDDALHSAFWIFSGTTLTNYKHNSCTLHVEDIFAEGLDVGEHVVVARLKASTNYMQDANSNGTKETATIWIFERLLKLSMPEGVTSPEFFSVSSDLPYTVDEFPDPLVGYIKALYKDLYGAEPTNGQCLYNLYGGMYGAKRVASNYRGKFHPGIDMWHGENSIVYAPVTGRYTYHADDYNTISIPCEPGYIKLLHMKVDEWRNDAGNRVTTKMFNKGDPIGKEGDVGVAGSFHTHVEYGSDENPINIEPLSYNRMGTSQQLYTLLASIYGQSYNQGTDFGPWNGYAASSFGVGSGTPNDPYLITTGAQLAYLAQQVNSGTNFSGVYFKQTHNIVLNAVDSTANNWTPIGTSVRQFSGIFDGSGHAIKKLHINRPDQDYVGLFGNSIGFIKNLTIEGASVTGKNSSGVLAGQSSGTVENCTVTGGSSLTGENSVGFLVGFSSGTVSKCSVTNVSNLTGRISAGGLVGFNSGSVNECSATNISSLIGSSDTGGLVGQSTGKIAKSHATVNVHGSGGVGGLLGTAGGSSVTEHSYSTGNVTGTNANVGGFVGYAYSGAVMRNSFSMGNVSGSGGGGGFVGCSFNNTKAENCYSLANHLNGLNGSSALIITSSYFDKTLSPSTKPEGRTTVEMHQKSTYAGWDFTTVWEMAAGDYPTLRGLPKPV